MFLKIKENKKFLSSLKIKNKTVLFIIHKKKYCQTIYVKIVISY